MLRKLMEFHHDKGFPLDVSDLFSVNSIHDYAPALICY